MQHIDWSRLGDGAEAAYASLHEAMVSHYTRLAQFDSALARRSIRQHLDGQSVDGFGRGFVLFPTLGIDVKNRLDELGITPEPPMQKQWFLDEPNRDGWRLKSAEQ